MPFPLPVRHSRAGGNPGIVGANNIRPYCFKALSPNHVHLWRVPLDLIPHSSEYLNQALQFLSPKEQENANRFHFSHHRQYYILSHWALRVVLGRYVNQAPETLEFEENAHGKPGLKDVRVDSRLRGNDAEGVLEFNLSHSKDFALIGLRLDKTIGVDIEYQKEIDYLGLGEHVFSQEEFERLKGLSKDEQTQSFFHLWTQKEAIIKATGKALWGFSLKNLTVSLTPPAQIIAWDKDVPSHWAMRSFMVKPDLQGAIATPEPLEDIYWFDFEYPVLQPL